MISNNFNKTTSSTSRTTTNSSKVTNVETRSEGRRYNRRLGMNDVLIQMPDSDGNIPQNFRQTFSDVDTLNNADAGALLQDMV
jgi:hypothetical protein